MAKFFSSLLNGFSLRAKFLVAPIILLLTIVMLASMSYRNVQHQKDSLLELKEGDLLVVAQLSLMSTRIAHIHARLYDILDDAKMGNSEEFIYEKGKPLIEHLVGIEQLLELGLLKSSEDGAIESVYGPVKKHFELYKISAIAAIEMASVDYMLARDELLAADALFSDLVVDLQEGMKVMNVDVANHLDNDTLMMEATLQKFILMSFLGVFGLFFISLMLSKALTKDFDSLIEVLGALAKGSMPEMPKVSSGKEVGALAEGITAFHQSLRKVDEQRLALEDNNKKLSLEILEREKTEADLIETRSRFQYALDHNPTIVYTARPSKSGLDVIFVSENSRKIVGYDPADLLGGRDAWVERFSVDDSGFNVEEMGELFKSGALVKDYQIRDAQGEKKWVQDSLMVSYNDNGPSEVFGSLTDISEVKESQEQLYNLNMELYKLASNLEEKVQERTSALEKANMDLEKLSESKSEFVSIVSHDLRTPLTGVKLFTDIMLDDDDLDRETQKEYLSIISSETDRLSRLITNILDFQKISAGKMQWSDVYCDIVGSIRDCIRPFRISFEAKGIDFSFECDEDELMTVIDVDRLSQVVYNLLSNSLKFTEEGSVKAALKKVDTVDGEKLLLSVIDTGPGIPDEQLKKIFEPFEQYEDVPLLGKGTGLGLYITNCVADRYHGRTWAESIVGRGSSFFVELPIRQEDNNAIGGQSVG